MRDGYSYTVLDNGASRMNVSCNEHIQLELNNGLFAGTTFTTQRCLISRIAGSSDTGMVFKVQ